MPGPTINARVFGSNVAPDIQNIFKNLQQSSFDRGPNESIKPYENYLGDRTTFARMWTPTLVTGTTNDEVPKEYQEIIYHVINDNRTNSYEINTLESRDKVVKELQGNDTLKPAAGITEINSTTAGALGSIKYTEVNFVVYSRRDFEEIYFPHFMKPGSTVVIDYGWSDDKIELYDIEGKVKETDIYLSDLKKQIYGSRIQGDNGEEVTQRKDGNYYYYPNYDKSKDAVFISSDKVDGFANLPNHKGVLDIQIGRVMDYNADWDGTKFNCRIKLASENTTLLDHEVTRENKLKYLFTNQFEKILIDFVDTTKNDISAALSEYDLYTSKGKAQVLNKVLKSVKAESDSKGVLNERAVASGLFYQQYTAPGAPALGAKYQAYISYGLFEDLFLNAIVLQRFGEGMNYNVEYNSKDCVVRWEKNLVYRQQANLKNISETLPLFLYPSKKVGIENEKILGWKDSYNLRSNFPNDKERENFYNGLIKDNLINLRDLFISVPLIKDAFAKKQNINDALIHIYDSINSDSYGVFNLKIKNVNESFASIGVQDISLTNQTYTDDPVLTFDVYSPNSIVSAMTYNFTMPKGGLANSIAIGQTPSRQMYNDKNLDDLRFIEELNKKLKGVKYLNLPLPRKKSKSTDVKPEEAYDFDLNTTQIQGIRQLTKITNVNFEQETINFDRYIDDDAEEESTADKVLNEEVEPIILSDSQQDYYGKEARKNTVLGSGDDKQAPILPVELGLTLYGNTYLTIGDIINVSYLPEYLRNRVFFIIVGVEHKIGTTWETTYKCQMRLIPTFKASVVIANKRDASSPEAQSNNLPDDEKRNLMNPQEISSIIKSTKDDRNKTFINAMYKGNNTIPLITESSKISIYKTQVVWDDEVKKKPSSVFSGNKLADNYGKYCYNSLIKGMRPKSAEELAVQLSIQTGIFELLYNGPIRKRLSGASDINWFRYYALTQQEHISKSKPLQKSEMDGFYYGMVYSKLLYAPDNISDDGIITHESDGYFGDLRSMEDTEYGFDDSVAGVQYDELMDRKSFQTELKKLTAGFKLHYTAGTGNATIRQFVEEYWANIGGGQENMWSKNPGIIMRDIAFCYKRGDVNQNIEVDDDPTFVYCINIIPPSGTVMPWLFIPKWVFDDAKVDPEKWANKISNTFHDIYQKFNKLLITPFD